MLTSMGRAFIVSILKPFLILQLRPEDDTSDNEFAAILKYGGLQAKDVRRIRIEKNGIPDLSLDDYSAIIVGGSAFDISTPVEDKSAIQKQIESDFNLLFDDIVKNDFPFLGACSGNGLLGSYLDTSISSRFSEPVSCVTLNLTDEGKKDSLLAGFPEQIAKIHSTIMILASKKFIRIESSKYRLFKYFTTTH